MTLFVTMLPIYLFGNLHCMGMCGPLVMMIGRHRFRALYFIGRTFSFSFAGALAGGFGSVIALTLKNYQLQAIFSFLFGGVIVTYGLATLFSWSVPGGRQLGRFLSPISSKLSLLLLKDEPLATFLFGFFTVALPCGQTLLVFSACALYGGALTGFLNGMAFALLTSPALFLSMKASALFLSARQYYDKVMGGAALFVGFLAIFRGMAELEMIPHLILNPDSAPHFHLVLY